MDTIEINRRAKTCKLNKSGKEMDFTNVEIMSVTRPMNDPLHLPKPVTVEFVCDIGKIETTVDIVNELTLDDSLFHFAVEGLK